MANASTLMFTFGRTVEEAYLAVRDRTNRSKQTNAFQNSQDWLANSENLEVCVNGCEIIRHEFETYNNSRQSKKALDVWQCSDACLLLDSALQAAQARIIKRSEETLLPSQLVIQNVPATSENFDLDAMD